MLCLRTTFLFRSSVRPSLHPCVCPETLLTRYLTFSQNWRQWCFVGRRWTRHSLGSVHLYVPNVVSTISWKVLDVFSPNFQHWCILGQGRTLQVLGSKGHSSRSWWVQCARKCTVCGVYVYLFTCWFKVMKVKLQPASATDLPAHNPILPPAAITQVMLIAHRPQVSRLFLNMFTYLFICIYLYLHRNAHTRRYIVLRPFFM